MFCRFCGKKILEDSSFCPYCGKFLSIESKTHQKKAKSKIKRQKHTKKQAAGKKLQTISKIFCSAALILFLIFYIKMAPGLGPVKFFAYIVGASIAVVLAIFYYKKSRTSTSPLFYRAALITSISVILLCAGLRITYEVKLPVFFTNRSSAYFSLKTEEKFYSYIRQGVIQNPSTLVKIGDVWCKSGDIIYMEQNKPYTLQIDCRHQSGNGSAESSLTLTKKDFLHDCSITQEVSLAGFEYAEVTLTLNRIWDFWEVILY